MEEKWTVRIGDTLIGEASPVYLIAEIGINHNVDLEIAKKLIATAKGAGWNMVKFQKRVPRLSVPRSEWDVPKDTPWGVMSYIEYKEKMELSEQQYDEIHSYCRSLGIAWTVSVWDIPSVEFMEKYNPPALKVPSAKITDIPLLQRVAASGKPVVLSTGMSTVGQIAAAVSTVGGITDQIVVMHCNSSYPAPCDKLNLRFILKLMELGYVVGYSSHEPGLSAVPIAIAYGARIVEKHITLDRAMWGTDQAASVEPGGMYQLRKYCDTSLQALGDGIKVVTEEEAKIIPKLRG